MGGSLGGEAETWGVAVFVWWAKHIHVVEGCLVTLYSTIDTLNKIDSL